MELYKEKSKQVKLELKAPVFRLDFRTLMHSETNLHPMKPCLLMG